ncbi:MAG TPA: YlxR family protein [Candidatus Izemoplasmatales bacterium]|nr:YlxR family protein [Bacillota bacterium]HRY78403.1 YlxR family protein [Candidatus Izemoplasmatales bacterium]
MKVKKIPLRKCVVTNEHFEKKQLLRVVKSPEGLVTVDLTGKANGRGAYLSKSAAVIREAKKTKVLERHLETKIPDEVYEALLKLAADE